MNRVQHVIATRRLYVLPCFYFGRPSERETSHATSRTMVVRLVLGARFRETYSNLFAIQSCRVLHDGIER